MIILSCIAFALVVYVIASIMENESKDKPYTEQEKKTRKSLADILHIKYEDDEDYYYYDDDYDK